jgi:hypothetical protein
LQTTFLSFMRLMPNHSGSTGSEFFASHRKEKAPEGAFLNWLRVEV